MTPNQPLTLTVRHPADSIAVLTVAGEIDVDSVPALRTRALELIRQGRPHLVLDLAPVEFCDSSGLNTMIGILRYAKDRHGSLSLVGPPPHLTRLLDVTGVGELMPVLPTTAEALTHIVRPGEAPKGLGAR
ncbi:MULTISPECIES: STAS domain-containing protein [Streptomyces]|uniref:Anti-sigma factor antagonist n=1 Tax=Streptomyces glycanivorans TaxID=3033808 RepID=A0ABY9JLG1_9ACTN|nr:MULTISPECIES: STAS domain-containing protein [unclassified Streptomyces]WLQ68580.1 STAS domain-containing protein [Streptomyces sp. Alt3]WSQ89267.1 STAS domain-containing protein [Streptomyces sp. NBC_01212]